MPITGQSPKEVIHTELHKFKHGQLHSGSEHGRKVTNRKQAIAIALSEARRAKRAVGGALFGNPIAGQAATPQPSIGQTLGDAAMPLMTASPASAGAPIAGLGTPAASTMASPPPAVAPAVQLPAPSAVATAPRPPAPSAMGMAGNPALPTNAGLGAYRPPGRDMGGMIRPPNPNWTVRNEARSMLHSGPISSIVPGRTDRHNVQVGSGAYVMPADAVSHLGQNNTKAGQAILSRMFGHQGPYGMGSAMQMRHGAGPPKPPHMQSIGAPHIPKLQSAGGGKGDRTGEPVPIVVAGGEFTIPPEAVAAVGGGDIKRGHRLLDKWVLSLRQKHIATLKGLPPPAKS